MKFHGCLALRVDTRSLGTIRIDNLLPLKTQAQGRDLNPEPEFLRTAGPMDQEPTCLRFSEIEPLQAEGPAKSQSHNTSTGSIMMVPKEEFLEFLNGGREGGPVNFMSLKSSQSTAKKKPRLWAQPHDHSQKSRKSSDQFGRSDQ
ncbi:hypothetical protein DSO57_1033676 [Entomophthora muscae]|uniref:Uncharacterized protein n=1 Tax=Entomophthora muscae TaxID=34485 RepID=A0ACC2SP72_9FUNG|nr:hypothetical protein DSO57_1033676 [Entomophthora muscae]